MINGFLLLNKQTGISSYDCIRQLKRIIGREHKIGHAGTLDPFASGLLIIGISRQATKQLSYFMQLDKVYIATGKFGELSSTGDPEGEIVENKSFDHITKEKLLHTLQSMIGDYKHCPPIYSALKHKGQPLYKLARNKTLSQEEITTICKRKQRRTTIHSLDLLSFEPPNFTIKAHVSHGTYIRSLVQDIAEKLNTVATTIELQRTQIGNYSLDDALTLTKKTTQAEIKKNLLPTNMMATGSLK